MAASRQFVNLVLAAMGVDPTTIPNDSVAEQRARYLLKNHDTVTGSVGSATLTNDGTNVSDGDTVTVGTVVYRFKTTPAAAYDVKIGASNTASLDNFVKAVNGSGTPGTEYFAGTQAHPLVVASARSGNTVPLSSRYKAITNTIATTETSSHLSFGGATMSSGLPGMVAPSTGDQTSVAGGQPV